MQKTDFTERIEIISTELSSVEIVKLFNESLVKTDIEFPFQKIIPFLFTSKSNYDRLIEKSGFKEILNLLNTENIYSEKTLSNLTSNLKTSRPAIIISQRVVFDFYNFHKCLLSLTNLTKSVLINEAILNSMKNEENSNQNDIIIFQVLIETYLSPSKYAKILTLIDELINVIDEFLGNEKNETMIVLLDSGSDTNLGIKSNPKTLSIVFEVFSSVFKHIFYHKYAINEAKNKALMDNLNVISEIKKKIEQEVISEADGQRYIHTIKTRTDKLIGLNVFPKKCIQDINELDIKNTIGSQSDLKLLDHD